ncbi:MAG TPA: hypothetical protein VD866_15320 [Urbifossiella sp.]|nr:hypothetical protein [Urbifossiella sp.]
MSDPLADLFKTQNLHALKAVGYHMLTSARDKGEDTAKPLAFIGIVTIAIGAMMLLSATKQMNRGDGWSR